MSNSAIVEKREKHVQLTETFNTEFDKFINGNASAGARARKALAELSKLNKEIRADIQEIKNNK